MCRHIEVRQAGKIHRNICHLVIDTKLDKLEDFVVIFSTCENLLRNMTINT